MKKKLTLYCMILFSLLTFGLEEQNNLGNDDFWKLSEIADQADSESFRECVGKARKAAEELNIFEAEFYAKEAKKYMVDMKKDVEEYNSLLKLIEKQKKAKYEYERKEALRNMPIEEGDVIINADSQEEQTTSASIEADETEQESIYDKVPVYYWQRTLSGETKYILRYKQMFCIISYDKLSNEYFVDVGQKKTFSTFIDVMRYAIQEVNYKGNVTDCVEVNEDVIYSD